MKGWLIAGLATLGALLVGMVKADLEDEKVCRWLARTLVYRTTRHLPADERDRWREELIRDLLDLQGRVAPLLWAFSVYLQAGRWGRMRGMPSQWEVLVARTRAAWQRLRSLPQARARARAQQLHPASIQAQAQTAHVKVVGFDAQLVASGTTRSGGSASLMSQPGASFIVPGSRDGMMHLTHEDFVAWLSQQRQAFEDDIDRQIGEWRQGPRP